MIPSHSLLHGLVLQTRDLDEAASCLGDAAIPYVSELLPGSPAFSTQIFVTQGQRTSLARVVTNGTLRVESSLPADSYALVLDLRKGVGWHRAGEQTVFVGPEFALVHSPVQEVEVRTLPHYEVLFVRIAREAVFDELQRLMGREPRTDLVFSPALRLNTAAGCRLRQLCDSLRRTLYCTDRNDVMGSTSLRSIESDLITLLLQSQPHNYRRSLNRTVGAGVWQVRAAAEFMQSNAHLPISLGDVCQAAGVNARTLQDSFHKKCGCTPMEFLRQRRLEEVRNGLLHPADNTTVTAEAAHWGFQHFGRFSSMYEKRFGELPSVTLRRSRRHVKDRTH